MRSPELKVGEGKQLAFCSLQRSFCSHSCDVVHAEAETADRDDDNDGGWMKRLFCCGLKFNDKACWLSDLPASRKNRGNKSLFVSSNIYTYARVSGGIPFRGISGVVADSDHFKVNHKHACVVHQG